MSESTWLNDIGPEYARTLAGAGIFDWTELFEATNTPIKVDILCFKTGVRIAQVRQWAAWAVLLRVVGMTLPAARLLEAAGVASVKDLAACEKEELAARLVAIKTLKDFVEPLPGPKTVQEWITAAQQFIESSTDRKSGDPDKTVHLDLEENDRIGWDLADELPGDIDKDNNP